MKENIHVHPLYDNGVYRVTVYMYLVWQEDVEVEGIWGWGLEE